MLFDLRSRGRRRTVQFIYLGLAVLMGGGLILFGVGTGSGTGGLLNAFSGNGGGNPQNQVVNQQTKAAIRQTQQHPNDPAAWSSLVTARWTAANSAGYDANTSTYNATGKKQLALTTQAWQRYAKLTDKPDPNTGTLAARAYGQLGQYSAAASAWQAVTQGSPGQLKAYECLALTSFAAKQDRVGGLAEAKVLSNIPKAQRKTIQSQLEAAKKTPSAAAAC